MNLKIGKLGLKSKAIAAPMAGFTDKAWRILATGFGAGLVFSEMVSVEGLWRSGAKTLKYLDNDEKARPFGLQLFGAEPESFTKAVDIILKGKNAFDLIDINMGCPVKKVVKRGAGSALMKDPKKAGLIIKTVRKIYSGPLTVKIRAGWSEKNINAAQMALVAQENGADAVIVHPRTQNQFFKGQADWNVIRSVKEAVKIPVIGNGDVVDKESCDRMLEETGCDGVMLGRAAISRPWVFRVINGGKAPEVEELFEIINEHFRLLLDHEDEAYAMISIKKFMAKYLKGIKGSKTFINEAYSIKISKELLRSLAKFRSLYC